MDVKNIIEGILAIDNINDLKDIYSAYKKRADELINQFLSGFKGGDIVEFYHNGFRFEGEIIRVNRRTITVSDNITKFEYRILSKSLKLIKAREDR